MARRAAPWVPTPVSLSHCARPIEVFVEGYDRAATRKVCGAAMTRGDPGPAP